MDGVAAFGFAAAIATLICWAYERESTRFTPGLAAGLAALSTYAFMQGAWPVAIVAAVWSVSTVARWRRELFVSRKKNRSGWLLAPATERWHLEPRMKRMFGSAWGSRN
jgi:hypothetical protein